MDTSSLLPGRGFERAIELNYKIDSQIIVFLHTQVGGLRYTSAPALGSSLSLCSGMLHDKEVRKQIQQSLRDSG